MQPFTYLVGWTDIQKYYYGVRYAYGCSPADLMSTYFTSSAYVHELIETHGQPDVVQIRKTFATAQEAVDWEVGVLRRLDLTSSKWLNANVAGAIIATTETRKKISEAKKGKPAHNKGVPCSEEQKQKISATRKRRGLGKRAAKHLKPQCGDANPMRNPEVAAAYSKRVTGRKRKYRDDGTWFWHYPDTTTAPESAVEG
jgi:hypothetical protein